MERIPNGRYTQEFREEAVKMASARFCSVQAGFITGRNLLIDGGQHPGAF